MATVEHPCTDHTQLSLGDSGGQYISMAIVEHLAVGSLQVATGIKQTDFKNYVQDSNNLFGCALYKISCHVAVHSTQTLARITVTRKL